MKFKDVLFGLMTGGVYTVVEAIDKGNRKKNAEKFKDSVWQQQRAAQKFNNLTDEEKAAVYDYINAEKQYDEAFKNITE